MPIASLLQAKDILRHAQNRLPIAQRLVDPRFTQQKAFVLDASPSVAAVCTRRAGKSFGLGLRLFRAGFKYNDSVALYIALTRKSAKSIMWPVLKKINRLYTLGAEFNESELTAKLPNGSGITLVGADMENFIERLRGAPYSEVAIVEAGSFRAHLKELIEDVLEPATMDFNGSIVMVGTPGVVPEGVFYDAVQAESKYSRHYWTVYDNPHMPNAREWVARKKLENKWSDENPTYQREYLGQWVIDRDALVYKFKKDINVYTELPAGHDYVRVLSIDYGWNDATAFAVLAYAHSLREVFIEYSFGASELTPSQIAGKLRELVHTYKPARIVADTGGLGKSITEEMIRRYSIPVHPAEKKEKMTNIHLMNGDFIDKKIWVHASCTGLIDQYSVLTKGDDGMEDPRLPNDRCDAALYGFREAKHYLGEIPEKKEKPGSKLWADQEAERMLEEDIEQFNKPKAAWWEE